LDLLKERSKLMLYFLEPDPSFLMSFFVDDTVMFLKTIDSI